MSWVAQRSITFSIAALLALVTVVGGGIGLSYYAALSEAQRNVDSAARQTADRIHEVFWQSEGALATVAYLARGGCSPDLVMVMRGVVAGNTTLRNMAYLTPDGRLACTSFGVIDPPVHMQYPEFKRPADSAIWFAPPSNTAMTMDPSVIVRYPLENGGAMAVLFGPEALVAPIKSSAWRDVARATVQMDGLTLATVGMADDGSGNNFIRAVADVDLFDTKVSVAVPKGYFFQDWERGAVILGGVGLMLMAAAVSYAWQWSDRLSPMQEELAYALRHHELDVHYQPVIDLQRNRCIGAEALVRWNHPVRGLVHPDEFIPIAEETGQIIPMTRWLMRRVCEQVGDLLRADPDFHVTVNLSPPHFKSLEVVTDATAILAECRVAPSQVLFEITERGLVDDAGCRAVIEGFSEIGAEVAVDDFGTGYSSLAYIQNFRLDYLKIDQAFVKAIGTGAATAGLADVIIDMAKTLRLRIIAEGVETQAHVDFLKSRKVETAQGWFYSKPVEIGAFRRFVAEFNRETSADDIDPADPAPRLRRAGAAG